MCLIFLLIVNYILSAAFSDDVSEVFQKTTARARPVGSLIQMPGQTKDKRETLKRIDHKPEGLGDGDGGGILCSSETQARKEEPQGAPGAKPRGGGGRSGWGPSPTKLCGAEEAANGKPGCLHPLPGSAGPSWAHGSHLVIW